MESRYYQILRQASQEDYYQAVNNPDDELYHLLWDLFEEVVIEPAEIFDSDFREHNQFRYSINSGLTLEFFPEATYFQRRVEPNPFRHDSDAAGVHLKLSILPEMSCLFTAAFQVWGRSERIAFKKLWRQHPQLLSDILRRAKPMVFTALPFPTVDYATNLNELLDNYFSVRDPEHFLELQYSFAQFDESQTAQNFMAYMALLYHCIKAFCQDKEDTVLQTSHRLREFYSGRPPDLPAPLPCVELAITSDTE